MKPFIIPITVIVVFISYQIFLFFYFKSKSFIALKSNINTHITNCNDLNNHIEELKRRHRDINSYDYGISKLQDHSKYNFKRANWGLKNSSNKIHNCSASVVKTADNQPFKYLCKYFNIKTNEDTLIDFESTLNDFSAIDQGKALLENQKNSILNDIKNSIPSIIMFFSKEKLVKNLGFYKIDLSDLHFHTYTFQYISAGGNSSTRTDITLDLNNLEGFISYLSQIVKFKKTTLGQRALMTFRLREAIKIRDNYTCKICNLSIKDEANLLLEIDHIIPISKGGMTTENNLQTLCWRCNRTKGAKIL